jgi:hypothetical protein
MEQCDQGGEGSLGVVVLATCRIAKICDFCGLFWLRVSLVVFDAKVGFINFHIVFKGKEDR